MVSSFTVVGQSIPRGEGPEKVTGESVYGVDVTRPGMLWGKVLRSTLPHARIIGIDTSRARRVAGVHYGRYVVCIQCGYYLTEGEEVALRYTSQGQIAVTSGEEAGRPLKRGGERALMGTVAGPPPILGTPEAIECESA